MKIIIYGCGKIGKTMIETLVAENHDVTAIDKDPAVIEEVTGLYDIIGMCGGGVDCDVMNEAGIAETDLFVAVTGSDELNMLSCFLARRLGAKNTIARIRTPEYNDDDLGFLKSELNLSGTINPELLAAQEIYDILNFPSAIKVETFSGRSLKIIDFIIKSGSPFEDLALSQIRQKFEAKFLVCYVVRGDEVFIPNGTFVIKAGDKLGLTATNPELTKLVKEGDMNQKSAKSVMIVGASRTTYYLAKLLLQSGVKVKIIEKDLENCEKFAILVPKATLICCDALSTEALQEEGINSTDALISLTGNDELNILVSLASAQTVPTVIAKVNNEALAMTAENLGLDRIISPKASASSRISKSARAIENSLGSNVEKLYKLMNGKAEVLEFNVLADFKHVEIPLKDMKLKKNILIAGIIRKRKPMIPLGSDVILPGDKVIVVASGMILGDLSDIMA